LVSADGHEKETLNRFCQELGVALGDSEHQIILCSEHAGSADRAVVEGLRHSPGRAARGKLIVHRPDDIELRDSWRKLEQDVGLVAPIYHSHQGPDFRSPEGGVSRQARRLAFLLCQIEALREADVLVVVGGKTDGPSALLLPIAREQGKTTLPYRFLGGTAERAFQQLEGDLKARLDSADLEKLSEPGEGAAACLSIITRLRTPRPRTPPRVFLSYAWKRPDYADLVETILRRRSNVTVFRDEREIRQGESIDQRIEEEITMCPIFIALWGQDYVQSPYCHDEIELRIKKWGRDGLYLLRSDDTRPVWPALRRGPEDREVFYGNWPFVGEDRRLIEKAVNEILDDFEKRAGSTA
jgi:hypothetical protein